MESENQKVISEAEELPRTIVRRVVKEKLSNDGDDMSVSFTTSLPRIFYSFFSLSLVLVFSPLLFLCLPFETTIF